jgi:ABC-type phosphate transport system permease subunit
MSTIRPDSGNNMSGGIYISGWALIGMGIHLWPILFWGPLGVICGVYTLVGGIWSYDTMGRWKWTLRRKVALMIGIPIVVVGLVMLLPTAPPQ